MKLGQTVNFYRPADKVRKDAEVVGIDDAIGVKNKLLTLRFNEDGTDYQIEDVKHLADAEEGEPFWLIKGVEKAPAGWAEAEPAPDLEFPVAEPVDEAEVAPRRAKRR